MQIVMTATVNMQKYITELEKLGSKDNMTVVGDIIAEQTKDFIPTDSGTLREDYTVFATNDMCEVKWITGAVPYAHYQFEGRVYGPNKAVFDGMKHKGWRSPVSPKTPNTKYPFMNDHPVDIWLHDGRVIHIKGYNKKHSKKPGPNWTERAVNDKKAYYMMRKDSGRYMYEAYCLAIGQKPVGGFQVMGKYV